LEKHSNIPCSLEGYLDIWIALSETGRTYEQFHDLITENI